MLIPRHQILRWTTRNTTRDTSSEGHTTTPAEFPKLRMPGKGRKIFFWKAASAESVEPDQSETLETIQIDLHRWRLEYEHLSDLVRQTSCTKTLEDGYAGLAELLKTLEAQDAERLESLLNAPSVAERCREIAGRFVDARPLTMASEVIEAMLER